MDAFIKNKEKIDIKKIILDTESYKKLPINLERIDNVFKKMYENFDENEKKIAQEDYDRRMEEYYKNNSSHNIQTTEELITKLKKKLETLTSRNGKYMRKMEELTKSLKDLDIKRERVW